MYLEYMRGSRFLSKLIDLFAACGVPKKEDYLHVTPRILDVMTGMPIYLADASHGKIQ